MKNNFRYDINGLRAYAVALVVLFHFGVSGFSGGFIGVDVFFVISGFLMTKIIIEKFQSNSFSFLSFYLARAIRILPALLILTIGVTIFSWFFLIPEEYKTYAKHAASSITFLSNLMYFRESGDYFAVNTHNYILLHTWSLSVEWQFYIILPILLWVISKFSNATNAYRITVYFLFILSFILSIWLTNKNPTFAFYMIPTRAWEMLAGGIVYLNFNNIILTNKQKKLIELTGFLFIIFGLVSFDSKTSWPGAAALVPVVGSMLILIANNQESNLTKFKPMQFIGSTSYSIYLWHWPIVFFLGYFGLEKNLIYIIIGIFISIFLGWLSFRFVENPTRRNLSKKHFLKSYVQLGSITLILSVSFVSIFKLNGVPERSSNEYKEITNNIVMPLPNNGWCFYSVDSIPSLSVGEENLNCHVGSKEKNAKKALLFGDSYAGHNIPFWDEIGRNLNLNVNAITTNWCYPSLDENFTGSTNSRAYEQCLINRKHLKETLDSYDVVIFAGSWNSVILKENHKNSFKELVDLVKAKNIKTLVMSAPYSFDTNIGMLFKRSVWLNQSFNIESYANNSSSKKQKEAHDQILKLIGSSENIMLLNQKYLFNDGFLAKNNIPYLVDGGHLSVIGSLESAKYFQKHQKYKDIEKFLLSNQ